MPTMLERMANRIFVLERMTDGRVQITEACDLYFGDRLTLDELRQLGRELIELADNPELMPPDYQS